MDRSWLSIIPGGLTSWRRAREAAHGAAGLGSSLSLWILGRPAAGLALLSRSTGSAPGPGTRHSNEVGTSRQALGLGTGGAVIVCTGCLSFNPHCLRDPSHRRRTEERGLPAAIHSSTGRQLGTAG
jgi:hypothetical protein